jgi:hypothetical protein
MSDAPGWAVAGGARGSQHWYEFILITMPIAGSSLRAPRDWLRPFTNRACPESLCDQARDAARPADQ